MFNKIKQFFCKHTYYTAKYYIIDTCTDTNPKEYDFKVHFQGGRYQLWRTKRCLYCGKEIDECIGYTNNNYGGKV